MAGSRTIGTTLTKTTSGGGIDVVIGNLTNIGEIGLESDEIDVTTLDSSNEYKEFISGAKDGGEVSLEGNIVTEGSLSVLLNLADSRTVEEWTVEYPSGATWVFDAFVKSFKDGEKTVEGVGTFKASLRVSGKPVYTTGSSI